MTDLTHEQQDALMAQFAGLHPEPPAEPAICCGVYSIAVDGGFGCAICLQPHAYYPPPRGPRGRYNARVVSRFNHSIFGRIDEARRRVVTEDGRDFIYGPVTGPRDAVWVCWKSC